MKNLILVSALFLNACASAPRNIPKENFGKPTRLKNELKKGTSLGEQVLILTNYVDELEMRLINLELYKMIEQEK